MSFDFDPDLSAQQLVDILPNGIGIITSQYKLISASRRFQDLLPCRDANFRECWMRSIHKDDHDRVSAKFREAIRDQKTLRIEYRTSAKETAWCALTLESLGKADHGHFGLGGDGGFVCTVVDKTSEKTAEIVQREATKAARESKKQQERFIDMISHEVRNPLSAILHCTEDILEAIHGKKPEEVSTKDILEAAETIGICIAHQKKIVNDVLTFSKLDASMLALTPRSVQPKQHITSPLAIFRPEIRKLHIHFDYKADVSYDDVGIDWVMADLDRMGQVLVNLLSNAVKFTAESKNERAIRVSIGAAKERPASYPPNVVFFDSGKEALRDDATNTPEWGFGEVAYIMIAIKDSGIGISDKAQKKLFERFNQATPKTESVYGGSGLGLNVCRKLCHLHGGEIGVSSKEAEGSTFGFFFKVRRSAKPSVGGVQESSQMDQLATQIQELGNEMNGVNQTTEEPEISKEPAVTKVRESEPGAFDDARTAHTNQLAGQVTREKSQQGAIDSGEQSPNYHVLLIEDNSINRRILSRKLKSKGFQVTEAVNGQEGVNAARAQKFDCILMDQEMPVMNGCTAAMAIRDAEKGGPVHVPILGVTANVRAEQDKELINAGMDSIIHKPYSVKDLIEKINHFVKQS